MGNKNDRWSQLSMQQRADLIKLYTNNGITSLDTIKKNYNSFDIGGDTDNNDDNKNTSTLKQTVRKVKTIIPEVLRRTQYEPLSEAVKSVLSGSNNTSKDYENNIYEDVAQDTFLFSKEEQKDAFINSGYIEGTPGDYGLVAKAVGNRDLPVYQSAIDDITRDKLTVLGNLPNFFYGNKGELFHAGHYPTALYTDAEGNVYQKAWDLNNYGSDKSGSAGAYSTYDRLKQIGANILDFVGNPVVRTTGFQQISDEMLRNLMYHIKDPVLWEKLMNTKAFDAGNVVLNERIEKAYEDYIFNETMKLGEKESRGVTEEDFENMRLKTPLNVFRDNLGSYYDDQMLFHYYNIFDINKFDTGGDTDGDGNIVLDWIRKQLYDKIDPIGYNQFLDRVKAAILGKGEERYNKARDDIFATYLKIPKDERHYSEGAKKVSDATYTPTKSSEDSTYHKIDLTDKEKDALIYDALRSNANVGDNSSSHVFSQFFGPHQVGRGKDEKGEYVSYYDLWDLDPSSGESKTGEFEFLKSLQKILGAKDMSLGVGEPVEFYDRIYLNDYYGVTPQVDEGDIEGGYLPLAYVEASARAGSTLTGEDYYDSGETSIPTYSKGGKLNMFDMGGDTDGDEESIYMGELDEAVVKPAPVKAELNTYYPITSKYPFTGHSELIIHDNKPFHRPTIITSGGYHPDYNLVTNNCSDATRCAIEQIYGEKIDPFLFTTPGDVRDFLLEKGVDIYKTDKGKDTQYFEIPFATAMDLKNKAIDDIIYQQVMWAEKQREQLQKENPNWDSISFDASMHDIYRSLENEKYKIQPFVEGYEIDESGNYIKKNGGNINKFEDGTSDKYNVFEDTQSFAKRDAHIKSLKEFIKNNPEIAGLNTNDFFEFFSQLAGLESTYNHLAGEKMKYSGLYGLEGGRNYNINTQHKKAYEHLAKLFKSNIVQEDLQKGLELGYTPAQILAKYWNQGNRVTNFLHRGVDNQDGVGTNISDYGWNMTANVDYNKYLQKGITDDYVIVKPGVYLSNVALKSRNDDVDYSDATKSIINLNTKVKQHNTKNKDAKFDTSKMQIGDTIWLKKPPYLK